MTFPATCAGCLFDKKLLMMTQGRMYNCTSFLFLVIPDHRELKVMILSKMAVKLISVRIISPPRIQTGYLPE
jgi:hypothetical protein